MDAPDDDNLNTPENLTGYYQRILAFTLISATGFAKMTQAAEATGHDGPLLAIGGIAKALEAVCDVAKMSHEDGNILHRRAEKRAVVVQRRDEFKAFARLADKDDRTSALLFLETLGSAVAAARATLGTLCEELDGEDPILSAKTAFSLDQIAAAMKKAQDGAQGLAMAGPDDAAQAAEAALSQALSQTPIAPLTPQQLGEELEKLLRGQRG